MSAVYVLAGNSSRGTSDGGSPVSAKLFLIFFTRIPISNIEQGIMNVEG